MRRIVLSVTLAAALFGATQGYAQIHDSYDEHTLWVGPRISWWGTDEFSEGWGAGANLLVNLGGGLHVRFGATRFFLDEKLGPFTAEYDTDMLEFSVIFMFRRVHDRDPGGFYVGAGINKNSHDAEVDLGAVIDIEDDDGAHAFFGSMFEVNPGSLMFFEIMYIDYETEGTASGGLTATNPHVFDGWSLAAGILFAL